LLHELLRGLSLQTADRATFEVLVCDDGSTEALNGVVASFQASLPHLRHLRQKNQGPAAARNMGIAEARSGIVIFLDSDVLPGESVVAGLTHALDANPDWQGAEAKLQPVGGENTGAWDAPQSDGGGHYHTAGIAYRRGVLEHVGGFDEGFTRAACEDVELAVQILLHGTIGFVPEAVVYHPRRRRTVASCWSARRNWRFVQILACRYGFLGWPDNRTSMPRIRTAICAALTLPVGKTLSALKCLPASPRGALQGVVLAAVDWLAGLSMLPTILLASVPPRRSRFLEHRPRTP